MANKEAIEQLRERLAITDYRQQIPEYYEAIELAVEALEKQAPKKPIRMYREVTSRLKAWRCPSCGDIWCNKHNYCYSCGQRLDWNLDWSKEDA